MRYIYIDKFFCWYSSNKKSLPTGKEDKTLIGTIISE